MARAKIRRKQLTEILMVTIATNTEQRIYSLDRRSWLEPRPAWPSQTPQTTGISIAHIPAKRGGHMGGGQVSVASVPGRE
ncbi:hypothetical protein BVI434_370073 [Burkholderia vietnamiensis]|nr:hypothetical protein BVI434_370073 [Burkholderia vietnamiensis]